MTQLANATASMLFTFQGGDKHNLATTIALDLKGDSKIVMSIRCTNFLCLRLRKWYSKSNHANIQKLMAMNSCSTGNLSDQSKFLNKAPFLTGYGNVSGFEHGSIKIGSDDIFEEVLLQQISKFPCIKMGHSARVELPERLEDDVPSGLVQTCNSFDLSLTNIKHVATIEESSSLESSEDEEPSYEGNISDTMAQARIADEVILDKSVKCLPGITSKQRSQLEESGFHTVRKLLQHFPRTYADVQNIEGPIEDGQYVMSVGKVLSSRGIRLQSSLAVLEVVVGCPLSSNESICKTGAESSQSVNEKTVRLHLKQFFRGKRFTYQPFLNKIGSNYKKGDLVFVSGKIKKTSSCYQMNEFTIDELEKDDEKQAQLLNRPYPKYPSKAGLKPTFFEAAISRALTTLNEEVDPMPSKILAEFNLLSLIDAYMGIHRPKDRNEADLARKRFIFDEFFYLQLGRLYQMIEALGTKIEKEALLDKYKDGEFNTVSIDDWSPLTKKFLEALPYSLTNGQLKATAEIIRDLGRPVPMNRLLQGDVGCGKTVVAFLACMEVISLGYQAAFMVPTELLAVQHYEHLLSLLHSFEGNKPTIALLTGSTSTRQSKMILQSLQAGDVSMVIGTHSLIADKLEFSALRLAVIDEQHRFGVIQRGRFNSKLYTSSSKSRGLNLKTDMANESEVQMAPHILALSATPIPRTLALALYGDMSLTQISEVPPGRQPVETLALEGNDIGLENVFQMMRDELLNGGKVYVVSPIIKESEQLPHLHAASTEFDFMSKKFDSFPCGLVHGRMNSEEKFDQLKKFSNGEIRILVATQVIENGIDVPDASMMVVMNAERFGISQLHQLRGRVGRGDKRSKCIFVSSTASGLHRLKILEKSTDGFYLANADLMLRGPGDLLGKKQSGHLPEFPIARLESDGSILEDAHRAALKVLEKSHDLAKYPKLKVELSMRQPLCIWGD